MDGGCALVQDAGAGAHTGEGGAMGARMGGSGVEGMDGDRVGDAHMENGGDRGAHTTQGVGCVPAQEGGGEEADAQSNLDARVCVVTSVPAQVACSVRGGLALAVDGLSTPPAMATEEAELCGLVWRTQ